MRLPNLVIGGSPKSGTSSLFRWLAGHPDVCAAARKETFYLVDRGSPFRSARANYADHGLAGYAAWFAHCPSRAPRVLEATTHYLYQRTALEVLAELETAPVVIFMLREPADRVYSSFRFSQQRLGVVDPELGFGELVELASAGSPELGRRISSPRTAHTLANDLRYSRYADYLEGWLERLGERVHLYLFEEMRRDPHSFVCRVARRLGLDQAHFTGRRLAAANPTAGLRSPRLHRAARGLARLLPGGGRDGRLAAVYRRLQRRPAPGPTPEERAVLARLRESYRPHNQRLARLTGLDLAPWEAPGGDEA